MKKCVISALALAAFAGSALAQTVEYRIVERTGQTVANAGDAVLNFAVQARVTGAANTGLSTFAFDLVSNDPEANGSLALNTISNADGTYWVGAINSTSSTLNKKTGLASQYRYLAGINPSFGGVINGDSGTWVQTPNNDIGLITAASIGDNYTAYFGGTTAVDPPDLSDTATMDAFFGSNGNWINLYWWQYTVTDFTQRALVWNVQLNQQAPAQVFNSSAFSDGVWGPINATATSTGQFAITVQVVPAPASAALLGLGGLVAIRRRRA